MNNPDILRCTLIGNPDKNGNRAIIGYDSQPKLDEIGVTPGIRIGTYNTKTGKFKFSDTIISAEDAAQVANSYRLDVRVVLDSENSQS